MPRTMAHKTITFELFFPTRRQLQSIVQTSAADPSTAAFQQQLKAVVAASFNPPLAEHDVLISETSNVRVLSITIVGFEARDATPSQLLTVAASSAFISSLQSRLDLTVTMHAVPAIGVRVTATPSPPPSPAPTLPLPMSPPASSLVTIGAANLDTSTTAGTLSRDMLYVIIPAAVVLVLALACVGAFCMGKHSSRKKTRTIQVGRPALRRQISPEEQRAAEEQRSATAAAELQAPSPQGDAAVTAMRVEDVRLLELGMAVERTMAVARQHSGDAEADPFPSDRALASPKRGGAKSVITATDVSLKLDGMQAAIDDVNDSLTPPVPPPRSASSRARAGERGNISPRSIERRSSLPRSPRGEPSTIETRIRADANIAI